MAERRMFAKAIIDSDAFLNMPLSTQALYFHLAMRADDEGFVGNPKKIQKMLGATDDDCQILLSKRFVLTFESGIIVIKHWKIHNYIQNDRFKRTTYLEEKATLTLDDKRAYTECIQNVSKMDTQVSIGKVSIDKDSIDKISLNNEIKEIDVVKETACVRESKSSSPSLENLETNLNKFLNKFGVMLDNYDTTLMEMDFNLLTERFEESDWLKKNITSFKKICEYYPKIISGYYKDYDKKPRTDNSWEKLKAMLSEAKQQEQGEN